MTAVDDALAALAGLQGADSTLELFAISRAGEAAPQVSRVLLGDSLDVQLRERAKLHARDLADLVPRPYTPAGLVASGEVMHLSPVTGLLGGLEDVLTTGDVEPYDPGAPYVEHLRLLASRLTTSDGTRLTFWQALRPAARLEHSRFLGVAWSGDRFVRLEQEHVLLLEDRVDAVVVHGVVMFTRKATFERLFDYAAELRRNAAETYAAVTRDLRIEGAAELAAACARDPAMMTKMASVRRQLDTDPAYRAAMTMDKLVAFVVAHPETDVDVAGSGPDARLVYSPGRRRFKILKLLDDDYLHSLLTSRSYEATAKSDPL